MESTDLLVDLTPSTSCHPIEPGKSQFKFESNTLGNDRLVSSVGNPRWRMSGPVVLRNSGHKKPCRLQCRPYLKWPGGGDFGESEGVSEDADGIDLTPARSTTSTARLHDLPRPQPCWKSIYFTLNGSLQSVSQFVGSAILKDMLEVDSATFTRFARGWC